MTVQMGTELTRLLEHFEHATRPLPPSGFTDGGREALFGRLHRAAVNPTSDGCQGDRAI